MKTPFYELAEKYDNGIFIPGMCGLLNNELGCYNSVKYIEFLNKYFRPTVEEQQEYNQADYFWGRENSIEMKPAYEFRITALLFADLLWQDEMKGGKK